MDKRLSIYVSSPDSYSDVLAVFLKGYRRYWSDCPYEFILTTNTKSYEGILVYAIISKMILGLSAL